MPNYPQVLWPSAADSLHLGHMLLELPEELAWRCNVVYKGHTIKEGKEGWILVLRAEEQRASVVSFYQGDTMLDAYRSLWQAIHRGSVKWKADKYR